MIRTLVGLENKNLGDATVQKLASGADFVTDPVRVVTHVGERIIDCTDVTCPVTDYLHVIGSLRIAMHGTDHYASYPRVGRGEVEVVTFTVEAVLTRISSLKEGGAATVLESLAVLFPDNLSLRDVRTPDGVDTVLVVARS